jgi:hypothetical protein
VCYWLELETEAETEGVYLRLGVVVVTMGWVAAVESLGWPIARDFARSGVKLAAGTSLPDRDSPQPLPRLNKGLSEILDWYIQMAGAVATSWVFFDEQRNRESRSTVSELAPGFFSLQSL